MLQVKRKVDNNQFSLQHYFSDNSTTCTEGQVKRLRHLPMRGSTSMSNLFVRLKSGSTPFLCRTIWVTHSSISW